MVLTLELTLHHTQLAYPQPSVGGIHTTLPEDQEDAATEPVHLTLIVQPVCVFNACILVSRAPFAARATEAVT